MLRLAVGMDLPSFMRTIRNHLFEFLSKSPFFCESWDPPFLFILVTHSLMVALGIPVEQSPFHSAPHLRIIH